MSLRSLHERVLRQDESLGGGSDVAAASAVACSPQSSAVAGTGAATTNLPTVVRPLIGRDDQLDSMSADARRRPAAVPDRPRRGREDVAGARHRASGPPTHYPDGAFGVRLASVENGDQVPVAVADALGVPLDGSGAERDVRQRLISFLARRQMLLLVDNCEHVVDAAAGLIDDILGRCPDVTVLATSREALAVPDEVQVTVAPLDTPPEGTPPGQVLEYPAAQLFAERARAVRPGLVFDSDDLSAIGHISRALDGIPLALELAAARVSSMSPGEVADRLAHRFSFLTSGARTAEARQQTLRATVDWSYPLLTEIEQRVFDRLSVFRGGWTLTAAEAVVAEDLLSPATSSTPSAGSSSGPWCGWSAAPPPATGCWRRCGSTPPSDSAPPVRPRRGAPARGLLPRRRRAGRGRAARATGNARPCGCCARSNPTSGPPSRGCLGPVATSTPPW